MKVAVGIGCLVTLGLLAETTGFTVQQQLMEQQRNGIVTTKPLCKAIGGKCQLKAQTCDGVMIQGTRYCKLPKTYECCVPEPPPKGCAFGFATYSSGKFLEEACVKFQCIDGTWIFNDTIPNECGECQVDGDSNVITYDTHTHSPPDVPHPYTYIFNRQGNTYFAISQPEFDYNPAYEVYAEFVTCDTNSTKSCVQSVTYFESGRTITMSIPKPTYCNTTSETDCEITVLDGGDKQTIGSEVQQFSGTTGDVLVFEHIVPVNLTGGHNIYCINVVGSKGLRVAFCLHYNNYAFLYVWAAPSLKKHPKSLLYGLCDTYTGAVRNNYTLREKDFTATVVGNTTEQINNFTNSWNLWG